MPHFFHYSKLSKNISDMWVETAPFGNKRRLYLGLFPFFDVESLLPYPAQTEPIAFMHANSSGRFGDLILLRKQDCSHGERVCIADLYGVEQNGSENSGHRHFAR